MQNTTLKNFLAVSLFAKNDEMPQAIHIVQSENKIKAIDAEIRKTYDIPTARDYAVEVANSRLYMLLNDKEKKDLMQRIAKAKAAQKK